MLVTGLVMIWADSNGSSDAVAKTFAIGAIVAATIAQVCLLLAPDGRGGSLARRILVATVGLAAILAGMTSLLVLGIHPGDDTFYRAVGVVAILDVLGTVVGAALLKFGPGAGADRGPDAVTLVLPPGVLAALGQRATATGRTREDIAAEILRVHLDTSLHEPPLQEESSGDEATDRQSAT